MMAAVDGHLDVVRHLLEKGANPNAQDNLEHTALMMAAFNGNAELVQVLKKAGACDLMLAAHEGA